MTRAHCRARVYRKRRRSAERSISSRGFRLNCEARIAMHANCINVQLKIFVLGLNALLFTDNISRMFIHITVRHIRTFSVYLFCFPFRCAPHFRYRIELIAGRSSSEKFSCRFRSSNNINQRSSSFAARSSGKGEAAEETESGTERDR